MSIDTNELRLLTHRSFLHDLHRELIWDAADEIDRLRAQLASLQPDEAFDVTRGAGCQYCNKWSDADKWPRPCWKVMPQWAYIDANQHHVLDCWPEPSITLVKRPARKAEPKMLVGKKDETIVWSKDTPFYEWGEGAEAMINAKGCLAGKLDGDSVELQRRLGDE
jgi:hypothetical protein